MKLILLASFLFCNSSFGQVTKKQLLGAWVNVKNSNHIIEFTKKHMVGSPNPLDYVGTYYFLKANTLFEGFGPPYRKYKIFIKGKSLSLIGLSKDKGYSGLYTRRPFIR